MTPSERSVEKPGKAWLSGFTLTEPHPCAEDGGWPEFEAHITFYVSSDDPEVIAREREATSEAIIRLADADAF